MKILYLGAFRLPNCDAAAPRVLNVARSMAMSGHAVSFISWGGSYRESDKCEDGKYRIDGMEYTITGELDTKGSFFTRLQAKRTRGRKSRLLLESMKELPDAVILYNSGYKYTRKLLAFCKDKGIYLIHDMTEWYANNELRFTDIIPNWLNMTKLQHRVPNKIVISSYLDRYYFDTHNIVVPATCNIREEKWSRRPSGEVFSGITFIYAGNPGRKDKLHSAINVVQQLLDEGENIRFLILGVSKDIYLSNYRKWLKSVDLNPNIVFVGRVSQDDVPLYYKQSDFMLILRDNSRKSNAGFPTKFAESMVSGTSVIANSTSDIPRYLVDGENGFLLPAADEESLYETIKTKILTLTREEVCVLKSNAKKTGSEHFDYCQYGRSLEEFLNNLVL